MVDNKRFSEVKNVSIETTLWTTEEKNSKGNRASVEKASVKKNLIDMYLES